VSVPLTRQSLNQEKTQTPTISKALSNPHEQRLYYYIKKSIIFAKIFRLNLLSLSVSASLAASSAVTTVPPLEY
jgi:hypothetical protein